MKLSPVNCADDILPPYRRTPVGLLLEYHNLGRPFDSYTAAQLLIGMCMDNRKMLRLPDNFAYILRTGGANLRRVEFKVSFAIAVGGVQALCLIGHTQCGMVRLMGRRDTFIQGLVERAGWTAEEAGEQFDEHAGDFSILDEVQFVCAEARRLGRRYPKILVAPLLYRVEDNRLYQLVDPETPGGRG
jgi:carbonic anhydrase